MPVYFLAKEPSAFVSEAEADVRLLRNCTVDVSLSGLWFCQGSGLAAQSTHCVYCLFRINKVGHLYYSKWEQRIYMIWAYILVASVIVFGRVVLLPYPYCFLCSEVHPCMAHAQLFKQQLF